MTTRCRRTHTHTSRDKHVYMHTYIHTRITCICTRTCRCARSMRAGGEMFPPMPSRISRADERVARSPLLLNRRIPRRAHFSPRGSHRSLSLSLSAIHQRYERFSLLAGSRKFYRRQRFDGLLHDAPTRGRSAFVSRKKEKESDRSVDPDRAGARAKLEIQKVNRSAWNVTKLSCIWEEKKIQREFPGERFLRNFLRISHLPDLLRSVSNSCKNSIKKVRKVSQILFRNNWIRILLEFFSISVCKNFWEVHREKKLLQINKYLLDGS